MIQSALLKGAKTFPSNLTLKLALACVCRQQHSNLYGLSDITLGCTFLCSSCFYSLQYKAPWGNSCCDLTLYKWNWIELNFFSAQRPTAKELLKHKFITRYTKKTAYLTELIDRYRRWKSEGHGEESSSDDSDMLVSRTSHLFALTIRVYLSGVCLPRPFNLLPLSVPASFRDADGDVDQCPMWTFPTVRPTSMNKLQKGYTHTDSEVRQTEQRDGNTRSNLFSFLLTLCFLFAVRRFCEKATKVTVLVCFGNTHLQRGRPYCCFLYNLRFI